ncbi:MAG: sigma factor-like helix-turn-helix DNA-binding protein [Candidatus Babeliales bacterium]
MSRRKNRFSYRSKLSEKQFKHILMLFELDLTAQQIAEICQLNRNTVNRYLLLIRERIVQKWEKRNPLALVNNFEEIINQKFLDFSNKTIIGIVENKKNIFSKIIQINSLRSEHIVYIPLISCRKNKKSLLIDERYTLDKNKVLRLDAFWQFTQNRLSKFRGINKTVFYLHLKESEIRFNGKDKNIYLSLLKFFHLTPL